MRPVTGVRAHHSVDCLKVGPRNTHLGIARTREREHAGIEGMVGGVGCAGDSSMGTTTERNKGTAVTHAGFLGAWLYLVGSELSEEGKRHAVLHGVQEPAEAGSGREWRGERRRGAIKIQGRV